jgi:hypothetical protein
MIKDTSFTITTRHKNCTHPSSVVDELQGGQLYIFPHFGKFTKNVNIFIANNKTGGTLKCFYAVRSLNGRKVMQIWLRICNI